MRKGLPFNTGRQLNESKGREVLRWICGRKEFQAEGTASPKVQRQQHDRAVGGTVRRPV